MGVPVKMADFKNLHLISSANILRSRGNVTYWWCSHRSKAHRCPATVIQRVDAYRPGRHLHDYPADPGMKHRVKIAKQVKLEAKQNVFPSARGLVQTAFEENLTPADFNLPDQDLLTRRANRARQKMRPTDPCGEDFELFEPALPEDYLRHDIAVDGARHLIFATTTQLEILQKAKRWYVDGNFMVLRKHDPFTQLYSIHAFLKNDAGETKLFVTNYTLSTLRIDE